jgi:DNA-binding NtrC family response regulator
VQGGALVNEMREAPAVDACPLVGVVEDDPGVAALAADLCNGLGANASVFTSPTQFLRAFDAEAPRAVVLDWRLERAVGSPAFMAIRHRFPQLPVVCWTACPTDELPAMLHADPMTRVVDKAAGLAAFEAALTWALSAEAAVAANVRDGA